VSYTKIIFVVETKFQERDYRRYGVEILESNHFEVKVWECSALLHAEYSKTYTPPDPHESEHLVRIADYNQLEQLASGLGEDTVIIQPRCRGKNFHRLFRILMRSKAKYGQIDFGLQPAHNRQLEKTFINRLLGRITTVIANPKTILDRIYSKIPNNLKGLRAFDFLILGGGEAIAKRNHEINPFATKWVWTHTLDYDLYLQLSAETQPDPDSGSYIVYLDSYLPFHPTWQIMGKPAPVSPDNFYPPLMELFSHLEKKLGIPVIIAAHPRSKYNEMGEDYFGGRKLVFGETARLVRNARLSIGHFSTSNSYNVLFGKPVICVTTNELEASQFAGYVASMAEMLGNKALNIDENISPDVEQCLSISEGNYRTFHEQFIKKRGTPDISGWQIVSNFIKTEL
jgi:hypothetical protein